MKRLVEFPLSDGTSVVVQVDEPPQEGGVVRAARPGEIAEKATQSFEAALDRIRPIGAAILARLQDVPQRPDEVQVEFGISFSAQAGAILASTAAEGSCKVTLTWRPSQPAEGRS